MKKRSGRLGDTWFLDEVFVTIRGVRCYLWRAMDQYGDTLDIPVQRRRDRRAAARFLRRLLKGEGCSPRRLFTDKLRSYSAAKRETLPSAVHDTRPYANNRAELSHQPTRERKRKMRRFEYILGQKPLFVDYNFTEGIEWESRLRPFSTAA